MLLSKTGLISGLIGTNYILNSGKFSKYINIHSKIQQIHQFIVICSKHAIVYFLLVKDAIKTYFEKLIYVIAFFKTQCVDYHCMKFWNL